MRLAPLAALAGLAATAAGHAVPSLEERGDPPAVNGSMTGEEGFEVVIVYVRPVTEVAASCPATPTQCPGNGGYDSPPPSLPKPSPGEGSWDDDFHEKAQATGTFVHNAPIATIKPAVHWTCDTSSPKNVVPLPVDKPSELYYGVSDPTKEGHFAWLNYYFKTPSVNLDYCDHIVVTEYKSGSLTISFVSHEAYDNAKKTWVADSEMILVTYTEGCGDYDKGDRCYFKVNQLDFRQGGKGGIVIADGKACHPNDIIDRAETEWGTWVPRHGGKPGGSKPSNSMVSGSIISVTTSAPGGAATSGPAGAATTSGGGAAPYTPGSSFSWSGSPTSTMSGTGGVPLGTGTPSTNDSQAAGFSAPKSGCVPPTDDKYGLPTACLGDLFDMDLDDDLGWEDMPEAYLQFITTVAPGINDAGETPEVDSSLGQLYDRRRRSIIAEYEGRLYKRCSWWPCSAVKKYVVEPIKQVYKAAQEATSIGGSINKDISWKLPNPESTDENAKKLRDPNAKQVTSPWGDSILLKAIGSQDESEEKKLTGYLNIFCVGCGVSGSAKIAGRAAWSPIGMTFTKGELELNLDAQFVLKLGIDAQLMYRNEFTQTLLEVGLPGLTYGVITIGPAISVGTHVTLVAEAKGKLLAGAEMGLANAHVLIDFVNPGNSKKDGWEPYFKPTFEAEGSLMLSATLGLPIAVKCGLRIATWEKSIALIDEPSVKGTAQVAASIGRTDAGSFAAGFKDTNGCMGISTQISWRNKLWFDLFGVKQYPLLDTGDKLLAQNCIKLPGLPAPPADPPTGDETTTPPANGDGTTTSPTTGDGEGAPPAADPPAANPPVADPPAADPPAADPPATTPPAADPPAADPPAADEKRSLYARAATNGTSTGNTTYVDLTSKVKTNGSSTLSYVTQGVPNIPYNDTTGYEYSLMVDPTATTMVVSCSNGNLYAFAVESPDNPSCSEMWATFRDVLVADGAQRLMHYYNNTMSKLGVSRLRVEDEADIPHGGVPVAFIPYDADDGSAGNSTDTPPAAGSEGTGYDYMYLAVDVNEQIFYPVVCDYEDPKIGSKIFLAADPEKGVATLKSEDVKYTVTGGTVKNCFPLVLLQGKYDESMSYAKSAPSGEGDLDYEDGYDV